MKTIALRFTDKFAPSAGTIKAHEDIIKTKGYVWYGKMGNRISKSIAEEIIKNESPRFLLIHSGAQDRYWMYFKEISFETPSFEDFPTYYHTISDRFKTWFKISDIRKAEKNVMSNCRVISSGALLSNASRHSMSPYFIIEYTPDNME